MAILFAVVMSYFTFLSFKRKEFTLMEVVGWIIIWLLLAVAAIFPDRFSGLAGDFGALRPLDLFTMFGFFVVLSISFYTYINVDRLRRKMEKAIRDLAIQDLNQK